MISLLSACETSFQNGPIVLGNMDDRLRIAVCSPMVMNGVSVTEWPLEAADATVIWEAAGEVRVEIGQQFVISSINSELIETISIEPAPKPGTRYEVNIDATGVTGPTTAILTIPGDGLPAGYWVDSFGHVSPTVCDDIDRGTS